MIKAILLKNFLFVYRSSQWLRQHFSHTGLLFLSFTIAAATFGLDSRQTLSFQIFAFLTSVFIISIILVLPSRIKIEIRRQLPEYGTVGQALTYKIHFRNPGNHSLGNLAVLDQLDYSRPKTDEFRFARYDMDFKRNIFDRIIGYPRLVNLIRAKRGADIQPSMIDSIPPHGEISKTIALSPLRRGYIYFSNTTIGKQDPLGLFRKLFVFRNPDRLLILPKTYTLPIINLGGNRRYQHGGLNLASSVGDSEEFRSLRDYRPGDPVRAIHWRSYARKGEPVIKEYQDEYFARMGLVLDTWSGKQSTNMFEEAVSIAATIILNNKQQDALLDLLFVNNRAYRLTSGRGLADTRNMLEVLACVNHYSNDNFNLLSEQVLEHINDTSGFILVLLDWNDARRDLVKRLRSARIQVLVILVSETGELPVKTDNPMADNPDYLWLLRSGHIQESIDQQEYKPYA